jgi:hypothetical protein
MGNKLPFRVVAALTLAVGPIIPAAPATAAPTPAIVRTWVHKPGSYPTIYVQHPHMPNWPITAAMKAWGVPIHAGRCRPGALCLKITPRPGVWLTSSGGTQLGVTVTGRCANRPSCSMYETAVIRLTSHHPKHFSKRMRLEAVIHEIGHALGLKHHAGSAMEPLVTGRYTSVSAADRRAVRRAYLG